MDIVVPDEFKYLYVTNKERPVVKIPAAVLRQVAKPVKNVGKPIAKTVAEMRRLLKLANGVGIAAPQIGVSERIILIAPMGSKQTILINPKIVKAAGEQIGQEGCLSIPGLYGDVQRHLSVDVEAYDEKGRAYVFEFEGMPARIVQHEIDHLDGKLFIDTVIQETLHWAHPDKPDDDDEDLSAE